MCFNRSYFCVLLIHEKDCETERKTHMNRFVRVLCVYMYTNIHITDLTLSMTHTEDLSYTYIVFPSLNP